MVLVGELVDQGDVVLATSITQRTLHEGCQFPEHFWNLLTRCLLLGDDPTAVEEPLARALLHASETNPTPLALFFSFHEKRGDLDACRAIVDGGGAFCPRLKSVVRRPAGDKVPRAKERFAELYRDAIAKVWTRAKDFDLDDLYGFRRTFELIGKKALKKHLEEIAAILPPPGKLR